MGRKIVQKLQVQIPEPVTQDDVEETFKLFSMWLQEHGVEYTGVLLEVKSQIIYAWKSC